MQIISAMLPWGMLGAILGTIGVLAGMLTENFLWVSLVMSLVLISIRRMRFPSSLPLLIGGTIFFGIAVGIWRTEIVPMDIPPPPEGRVVIEGTIVDEPDVRENYTGLTLEIENTNDGDVGALVGARVLLHAPRYPEYAYGDRIKASGKLEVPQDFSTDEDGRTFPYRMYLKKDGILFAMKYPALERTGEGGGNRLVAALYALKHRFISILARLIPEPEGSLLSGLLLGGKQALGSELLNDFRVAGIVHIVVLSGYNMTLVARWIVALAKPLGYYGSAITGVVGITLFTIMVGAGATAVRAAIMASIALLAKISGRKNLAGRTLLLAAFVMVMHQPLIVLYDPSFQLSFLATLGIIYGVPYLEKHTKLLASIPALREIVLSTIATQSFVLPFLLYQTGMFSLYALFANLLAVPLVPIAMFFGFWTGVIGAMVPLLGFVLAIPTDILLVAIITVARVASSLPYASIMLPRFSLAIVIVCYAALAILLFREERRPPPLRPREAPREN